VPLEIAFPVEQMNSLRDTIVMLKADTEIRNEPLDVLTEQLELYLEEVWKMRLLLGWNQLLRAGQRPDTFAR
jgi:hypothetical protein